MTRRTIITLVAICIAVAAGLSLWQSQPPANPSMDVTGAYLRSSTPNSKSAAAFLVLTNNTGQDDRLIAAASALDGMVQLHTHSQNADGVMQMGEIDGGVPIASGASHGFERGGDHLMFMGLTAPLVQGEAIPVTLTFEKAGEVVIEVPVDLDR